MADIDVSDNHPTLHPDFVDMRVAPGESHITGRHELFDIVNLITFGGAADRRTHVPAELGRIGPVVLWESTGAADQLPFWNTNCDGDAYRYVVHGSVRVEFKETDAEVNYGHYFARTGDLLRLPKDVAHRTFSGDGKRRKRRIEKGKPRQGRNAVTRGVGTTPRRQR